MSFNTDVPKITLIYKKNSNYKFLSSQVKIYRLKHILIIGKIVILPESINKIINNNSIIKNTNDTSFNEDNHL